MIEKLQEIEERFDEVGRMLTDPEVVSDVKQLANLSKEYKELSKLVEVYKQY